MTAASAAPPPDGMVGAAAVQRRVLSLLCLTQVIGGTGVALGVAVGALLAARLGGTAISGLAGSATVVGAALLALPVTRLMQARGRRPGLVAAYLVGAAGAALVVLAAVRGSVPLMFAGMVLFGGSTTANLQARYTAVDLAAPASRARQLSIVVWATTIGSVAAPNFADVAGRAVAGSGLPPLSGAFVFSAAAFTLAAVVLFAFLRPDPLLTARRLAAEPDTGGARVRRWRPAWREVTARPAARLGITAVAVGHVVMVAVMSMTPVHIGATHDERSVLRVVGVVLSLHIAGMFALSPLVGWLTDRLGRRPVIAGAGVTLAAACLLAAAAGHDTVMVAVALAMLGLGWSGTMVAGSTLLSESVSMRVRPAAQGLSDLCMGLAGAAAGALSGFVVQLSGFATLCLLAAVATVPLLASALRPPPVPPTGRLAQAGPEPSGTAPTEGE